MLKLTATAAVLALTFAPVAAFAAAQADGAFTLANVAPPETPEPPPATTPPADPNAPAATETPAAAPEAPATPDLPDATGTPEAVEGATPSAEPAPEVPDAAASVETTDAAAVTETPSTETAATGGMGMGTILGVLAALAVAAGAGYWFMNRKA